MDKNHLSLTLLKQVLTKIVGSGTFNENEYLHFLTKLISMFSMLQLGI
jgi:hypothetical protein